MIFGGSCAFSCLGIAITATDAAQIAPTCFSIKNLRGCMAFDACKYIDRRLSLHAILKRQKRDHPIAPPSPRASTMPATVDPSKKVLQFLAKEKDSWRNVPSISSSVDVSTSWAYSLLARLQTEGFVERQIKQRRGHHQKEFRITPQGLASIARHGGKALTQQC